MRCFGLLVLACALGLYSGPVGAQTPASSDKKPGGPAGNKAPAGVKSSPTPAGPANKTSKQAPTGSPASGGPTSKASKGKAPAKQASPKPATPAAKGPAPGGPVKQAPVKSAAPRDAEPPKRAKKRPQKPRQKGPGDEPMIRRGIYDRPYLYRSGNLIAIGGYVDLLGGYHVEEGISDGFSFEARRFNLFVFSSISRYVRLTAELEFEHGTEEIALETALVDIRLHSMLNLRGGILLVPLGRFNISHDSPIYDIIDRPLVSTRIIPATYSDVGGGLTGVFYFGRNHKLTYELYLINGLTNGILGNSEDGTRIAAGKTAELFGEDQNGLPAVSGRLGYTLPVGVEVGVSFYYGVYNQFQIEGEEVDVPRGLTILALDAEFSKGPVTLRGELALAWIDVPESLQELYAGFQWGAYLDAIVRVWKGRLWILRNAGLYLAARFDFIDLNVGTYALTSQSIGEETLRLSLGLSFRPTPQASLRIVYQHNWLTDRLGNPARAAGIQFGIATYF